MLKNAKTYEKNKIDHHKIFTKIQKHAQKKNIQKHEKYKKYDPQKNTKNTTKVRPAKKTYNYTETYDPRKKYETYKICRNGLRNQNVAIFSFFDVIADFAARLPLFLFCAQRKKTANSRKCFFTTHKKDKVTQNSIGLVGASCIVALI